KLLCGSAASPIPSKLLCVSTRTCSPRSKLPALEQFSLSALIGFSYSHLAPAAAPIGSEVAMRTNFGWGTILGVFGLCTAGCGASGANEEDVALDGDSLTGTGIPP